MADLMADIYSYTELAKKYANFYVPTVKIKINNIDVIANLHLSVMDLKVKLSLYAANIVTFKLVGIYDAKTHSFQQTIKEKFVLGTIVEIELGYQSSTLSIFKGFIAMVGAEFGEIPLLLITLMDARRLMMISGVKHVLHDVTNYSDAVSTILQNYSKLCSATIEATNDNLQKPLSQSDTDYDFIVKELISRSKVDREFFIIGETAYFRKPRSVKTPIISLSYEKEILFLKTREEYLDLDIEIIGYDSINQEIYTKKETVSVSEEQKKILGETPVFTITDPEADNQEKVNERAKTTANKREWNLRKGSCKVIGLPEIVPGRYIKIENLEEMVNHTYYITEVTHEMNEEDFTTTFEIGGW